jgi:hypothetical protein
MKRTLLCAVVCGIAAEQIAWAQSFSLDSISPEVQQGTYRADDILIPGIGAPPVLSPILGFNGAGAVNLEMDDFSYGRPLSHFSKTAPAYFSVDLGAFGVAGTAVSVEFNAAGGSEASSDVFFSAYTGGNTLLYDGNGLATAPNPAAPPLGVSEPVTFGPPVPPIPPSLVGDIDGLDLRSVVFGPVPGSPTGVIYFSLLTSSLSSGVYGPGLGGADVFVAPGVPGYSLPAAPNTPPLSPAGVSQPYATEIALGFAPPIIGNDIDALVVFDNGDNIYQPGIDIVLFSLRNNSPYLSILDPITGSAISPGDILIDGASAVVLLGSPIPRPAILHTAESLGLRAIRSGALQDDELNALDVVVPEPTSHVAALVAAGLFIARRRRGGTAA